MFYFAHKIPRLNGRFINTHKHTCTEIVYYHSGINCDITISDKIYKSFHGYVSVTNDSIKHSERHYSDGSVSYIGCAPSISIPSGIYPEMKHTRYIFDHIAKELREQKSYYNETVKLYIDLLCTEILRAVKTESSQLKDLLYIKDYITENFTDSISISTLAEQTGYSIDRFRHLFAETYGISPKKLITELRTKKALNLLINSNLSCTDIAYKCGFFDSSQMNRIIIKSYGVSPLKIRQNPENFL